MSVLAFAEVAFRYPGAAAPAVDGLSFTVAPGEGVALLGPNGAGKTTVTRLAAALRHPDGGRVLTAGRDTRGRRPEDLAEAVGYLFQHPEVQLFRRTVRAELAFGPEQLGWPADRIAARVTEVLGALGLDSHADAHPYDLPGPARRLVALGAATMLAPPLLVLDEPSAGLDRATRARLERLIREHRARGGAVLAVTHDAAFAVECLERALVLDAGRLRFDGPLADAIAGADLPPPPTAALSRALDLDPPSFALRDVAAALARRCRDSG